MTLMVVSSQSSTFPSIEILCLSADSLSGPLLVSFFSIT